MVEATALATFIGGVGTVATAGYYVAAIVINLAISYVLGKVLAPDIPRGSKNSKGLQNVIRDNIAPRRVIYGEAIVGGPYALLETEGEKNETLNMIIVLAGHPIEDVLGVIIEDEYINVQGKTSGTENVDINDLDINYYANKGKYGTNKAGDAKVVRIIKNLGWGWADKSYVDDDTLPKVLRDRERAELISSDVINNWAQPSTTTRDSGTGLYTDSGYKLTNCAYIYVSLVYEDQVWSGYPQLKFHVKGKAVYNPSKDPDLEEFGAESNPTEPQSLTNPDSWKHSEDWTLCCLDYLTNSDYGLGARTSGTLVEVDWKEAISSYYESSELVSNGKVSPDYRPVPRYTINGAFETGQTPISLMEPLLNSGAGQLIYSQGKYKLRPGVYRPPASENDIINEDMIVSSLDIQTHTPRSDVFNKAAGMFVDAGYDRTATPDRINLPTFEPSDFPIVDPVDSSGLNPYEVIDGEEIIEDFDFPFTITSDEAQRLARLQLERVRQGLVLKFTANLKILKYSVGDNVYFEFLNNSKYMNEAFYNRLGLDDQVQNRPDSPFTPYYKQFRIISMEYNQDFNIDVVLVEESEEIYDWNDGDANTIDYALISEITYDNPTDPIELPTFNIVDEVISYPHISTLINWNAPSRGSTSNLDRRNIRSYELEYGVVTTPSAVDLEDRVANWIPAGSFIVKDQSLDIQGPISIENIYQFSTSNSVRDIDFRIRARLFNGRNSDWAYYSNDLGDDYTPSIPPGADTNIPEGQMTVLTGTPTILPASSGNYYTNEYNTYRNSPTTSYSSIYRIDFTLQTRDQLNFLLTLNHGDYLTIYFNDNVWFKFRINTTNLTLLPVQIYEASNADPDEIGLAASIQELEFVEEKQAGPSLAYNPSLEPNIELRFERRRTSTSLTDLLDLNFDQSSQIGLNTDIFDSPYWYTISETSPDVVQILPDAGEEGSGGLYMYIEPTSLSLSDLVVYNRRSFRNPGFDLNVKIRYQSISGSNPTQTASPGFVFVLNETNIGFPGTGQNVKNIVLPPTGSGNWNTVSFIMPKSEYQYLRIEMLLVNYASETEPLDLTIDTIEIEPAVIGASASAIMNSNVANVHYEFSDNYEVDLNPATGNVTINILSSLSTGQKAVLYVKTIMDSTARSITWQGNGSTSNIQWAGGTQPAESTGSQDVDLYTFVTTDGSTWIGSAQLNIS